MEPEQILEQLNKRIVNRVKQLAISVTSGGVDNMETYKYIIGQINALESVRQEISTLQQDKGAPTAANFKRAAKTAKKPKKKK